MDSCRDKFNVADWLKAKMPMLGEDSIKAILAEWGIDSHLEPCDLTEREKDLILADGYFSLITACSSKAEVKDADGNWSHSEGALKISDADKQLWKNLYTRLRKKWGEEVLFKPSIKLESQGFRLWRKL